MRYAVLPFLAGLLFVPRAGRAQAIPRTVAAAEAEGAAFRRGAAPTLVPTVFSGIPYEGSGDRRCVTRAPNGSVPSGSLRSGELIVRTGFTGRWGLRADKPSKVVWFPLDAPSGHVAPGYSLLIRAAHIGDPADTLRETVAGETRGSFPSLVHLPAAGRWLIVATTGADWGCFVLNVADPKSLADDSR